MNNSDAFSDHSIITTDDGSYTLFLPKLGEQYHSLKGALSESMHVYINTGYNHVNTNPVSVLEIGFGTGLNTLLTLIEAKRQNRTTIYHTLEKYPLSGEIIKGLNYSKQLGGDANIYWKAIHESGWNSSTLICPDFEFARYDCDVYDFCPQRKYDVVYFDAFAPEVQPEMWTQELFNDIFSWIAEDGVLVTYCAKGIVRRTMQASGFEVERLDGPVGGKREILRATKKHRH
jgi:tRNA U34 5-methylaminomethyl-2-thiouridine-forming methyltransferase MnmC